MTSPTSLVAGNWKMNGLKASQAELEQLISLLNQGTDASCDVLVCPPMTLLAAFAGQAKGSRVQIGAQDCHTAVSGAHTGDISAEMIADAGASHVIVGHSERRADHGEDSALVKAKAEAAMAAGLKPIICVGETEAERDAGKAVSVNVSMLLASLPQGATPEKCLFAYEPVWAIGTGRTPTVSDVEEIHTALRAALIDRLGADADAFTILYGGSVKASNAQELMGAANVNGALVGGASLKAADFNGIIDAYR